MPRGLRDAGLAAGASRWQTIRDLVLPRAWAGILSGAILAISRGASEVAPVMFTGVAYFLPYLPSRLNDQFMELGYHVFVLATQSPDVRQTRPLLYASVVVLLSMTFLLHALAMTLRRRARTGAGRDLADPLAAAAGPPPAGGATALQEAGPVRRGPRTVVGGQPPRVKMDVTGVHLQVRERVLLRGVTLPIHEHRITAVIGPAGSGKAALLRVMSRMAEEWEGARLEGRVLLDGTDIRTLPAEVVRRRVALIERPVVFPRSIYDNVAYAPRLQGVRRKTDLDARVEASLRAAGLWREVRDQLNRPAMDLDPWQRVRLVLARALAAGPEVLLVDASVIVMDRLALSTLEELLDALKASHTLVIVTHDLGQAARLSEYTAFLEKGELVEFGPTEDVFVHPQKERTRAYLMRPYHYGTAP
ncbi:ATP-binding cassette domain-containing protein [Caldinitratiruptor microaerophilus]|uniref:ATP-binding cassette domain-containing protein n=1 Tax=Caldinitratiruptor microaerophilus TaxID=671077 RepID=UPI002232BFA6|nr:ATP-binding cassette domain-containing protein [Caldinitratiruptor microaerophilus]